MAPVFCTLTIRMYTVHIFQVAQQVCPNVSYYVPRNVNIEQVQV